MFHEVVRFPYHVTEHSQVVIVEKSLDDLLTKDNGFCRDKKRKYMKRKYKMASYMKIWPIMKIDDSNVAIESFSPNENATPWLLAYLRSAWDDRLKEANLGK
jgi:hypothetical protein